MFWDISSTLRVDGSFHVNDIIALINVAANVALQDDGQSNRIALSHAPPGESDRFKAGAYENGLLLGNLANIPKTTTTEGQIHLDDFKIE